MSVTVGELLYKLGADTSGLKKDLKDADDSLAHVGKTGRKAGDEVAAGTEKARRSTEALAREADRTRSAFDGIGKVAIGAAAVGGITIAINAASDLNEALNLNKNIFGDNAKAMEQWSLTSATTMGLARDQALSAAAGYANLFTNVGIGLDDATAMSQQLVALSADMASAFNTDVPDAIQAISAGLRGESEPLRRYGVMLDDNALKAKAWEMNLYDGKGALDQNAKAMAAYQIILEKTGKIQGDFIATSDEVANSQRVLQAQVRDTAAELGQSLLPAAKTALTAARDTVTWVSANGELVKTLATVAAAVWVAQKATVAWSASMEKAGGRMAALKGFGSALKGGLYLAGGAMLAGAAAGSINDVRSNNARAEALRGYTSNMEATPASWALTPLGTAFYQYAPEDVKAAAGGTMMNFLSTVSGGALDSQTGKLYIDQEIAATEDLNAVLAKKEAMQEAQIENDRLLADLKRQGLLTEKDSLALQNAKNGSMEDMLIQQEQAIKNAEALRKQQEATLQAMNLSAGAPAMYETKTETVGKGKNKREVTTTTARLRSADDLLASYQSGSDYQRGLTKDLRKLERLGLYQEGLTDLQAIEAQNPGTIAALAGRKDAQKYVDGLNKELRAGQRNANAQTEIINGATAVWDVIAEASKRKADQAGYWAAVEYQKGLKRGWRETLQNLPDEVTMFGFTAKPSSIVQNQNVYELSGNHYRQSEQRGRRSQAMGGNN